MIRCVCGGGLRQHQQDDDGCWCPRCLQGPHAARCKEWRPEEKERKPQVNRNVAPVGRRHPSTSFDAARKSLPKSGTRRYEVYRLIEAAGEQGMTDDELEYATARSHQSVSATRNTLFKDGLVKDSGTKRRTQWGNMAIAWVIDREA